MSRTPSPTGRTVGRVSERAGFVTARVKSSHYFMRHPDGRTTVVPVHAGEMLGPGLFGKIVRGTGVPKGRFGRGK